MIAHIVRGMAYVTVEYDDMTPCLSTIHALLTINGEGVSEDEIYEGDRFLLTLNNGATWVVYSDSVITLTFKAGNMNTAKKLIATEASDAVLQAALIPYKETDDQDMFDEALALLDEHRGVYATGASLKVCAIRSFPHKSKYEFRWDTSGSGTLLHYALPHHQDIIKKVDRTGIYLTSVTKGLMEMVVGDKWQLKEKDMPLPEFIQPDDQLTSEQREWVEYHLEKEIIAPLDDTTGSSVYFGGKHMMAYAQLCLIATEMGRDDLVEECLDKVEGSMAEYVAGTNDNRLVVDEVWGGIVGETGYTDKAADFFNTLYNDHHFHFGYLVNAGAVLGLLRPSWLTANEGLNKEFIDSLIRDVNSPNDDDDFFPMFRSFDWFCGHSWARGLLFSGDGKDQASMLLFIFSLGL
ncbi:unnamed protein product [Discosporangium mesarthrocarpum]